MKPEQVYNAHDGPIATLHRSPFFKDIVLTVGGWTFAIWKEGITVLDKEISGFVCHVKKKIKKFLYCFLIQRELTRMDMTIILYDYINKYI